MKSRPALRFVLTVEAMLSYVGKSIGTGWVFGLNEALDQAGATVGPLLVPLILYFHGGFRTGFSVLLIPALICLAMLAGSDTRCCEMRCSPNRL
jgi:MFS-type transporter involved in bile tolerance (Atg22 family)